MELGVDSSEYETALDIAFVLEHTLKIQKTQHLDQLFTACVIALDTGL